MVAVPTARLGKTKLGLRRLRDAAQVLEARPQLANYTRFTDSNSVLHRAATEGHVRVVAAVIEALKAHSSGGQLNQEKTSPTTLGRGNILHAVINQRTSSGQTPLMLACEHGSTECAILLMARGADPFLVDRKRRWTALHHASASGHEMTLRVLLSEATLVDTAAGRVPLRDAKVRDMSGTCTYVDTRAQDGYTALHLAVLFGALACVQALLDCGASVMVRTVDQGQGLPGDLAPGSTLLHAAAHRGDLGIVQAVLQAHADALGMWNSTDETGRREWENDGRIDLRSVTNALKRLPYDVARQRRHRRILRFLDASVPIDTALEECRNSESGFGPQRLTALAAYSLRQALLAWLQDAQARKQLGLLPKPKRTASACSGLSRRRSAVSFSRGDEDEPFQRYPSQITSRRRQRPESGTSTPSGAGALVSRSACSSATSMARPSHRTASGPADLEQQEVATPMIFEQRGGGVAAAASSAGGVDGQQTTRHCGASGSGETLVSPFAAVALAPASARDDEPKACGGVVEKRQGSWLLTSSVRRQSAAAVPGGSAPRRPSFSIVAAAAGSQVTLQERERVAAQLGRRSSPGNLLEHTVRFAPADDRAPPVMPRRQMLRSASEGMSLQPATAPTSGVLECFAPGWQRGGPPESRNLRSASQSSLGDGLAPCDSPPRMRRQSVMSRLGSLARALSRLSTKSALTQPDAEQMMRVAREASITGFENVKASDDCGICLDAVEEVVIDGCDHMLCVDCADTLCKVHQKPPRCPFCRRVIHGFHYASGVS